MVLFLHKNIKKLEKAFKITLYVLLGHICPLSKNGHKFLNFRKFKTKKDLNVFVFITFDKKKVLAALGQISMKLIKKTARFEKNIFCFISDFNAIDSGGGTFISVKKFFFSIKYLFQLMFIVFCMF